MANTSAFQRADTVNLLWQFKRRCDQCVDQGMPMVHFKLLLEDDSYREDILNRAEAIDDEPLRGLARTLRALQIDGALRAPGLGKEAAVRAAPTPVAAAVRPVDAEPLTEGSSVRARGVNNSPIYVIAIGLLAILVSAWWVFAPSPTEEGSDEAIISGSVQADTQWRSDTIYRLRGLVFVEPGVRLSIAAGTQVRGEPGSALIVTRGAQIHARGSAQRPVVFSSAQPAGQRAAGDWGGVVLLGDAPINRPQAEIEGVDSSDPRGDFGGDRPDGSCGVLEYVRIEFAGFELSRDNELNGLTLGACGSGTIIRYVQVHRGLDDGVEMFGGTVDLSHVLVSGTGDDSFDWDMGWQGRAQFIAAVIYAGIGDNGFEGDNFGKSHDAEPRSAPQFSNVTLIADRDSTRLHRGMTLRRGTSGVFQNVLMSGFNAEAVDIRDTSTADQLRSGAMDFRALVLHQTGAVGQNQFPDERGDDDDDGGFDEQRYFAESGRAASVENPGFAAATIFGAQPQFVPDLIDWGVRPEKLPKGEFWDEGAQFIGAFRPGSAKDQAWTAGWTAFPEN